MRRKEESEKVEQQSRWAVLSQSLPEGKPARKQEMRSMVGLRGTVQIRHTLMIQCHRNLVRIGLRTVYVQCGPDRCINGGMELG